MKRQMKLSANCSTEVTDLGLAWKLNGRMYTCHKALILITSNVKIDRYVFLHHPKERKKNSRPKE